MYKRNKPATTSLKINSSYEGERIEQKVNRIVNNKEPIKDGAPIIYTERKDGVLPAYDIRTDKYEIAVEAMEKVSQAQRSKRKSFEKKLDETNKTDDKKPDGQQTPSNQDKNQPTQTPNSQSNSQSGNPSQ